MKMQDERTTTHKNVYSACGFQWFSSGIARIYFGWYLDWSESRNPYDTIHSPYATS